MPTNDFLTYADSVGANVEAQGAYAADADRTNGAQTGIAKSNLANKAWRQAAAIASALAQLCVNTLSLDMLDNANQSDKITKLGNTIKGLAWLNAALTGTPTAPTVAGSSDSSTKIATTAFVQAVATVINAAIALLAPIASPAFTGTPTGTTPASALDNTLKIPTTAWIFNWATGSAGYTRKAWATYTIAGGALALVSNNGLTLAYVSAGVYTLTAGALPSFGTGALKINISNGANTTPLVGFGPRLNGAGSVTIRSFTLATTAADGDFIDISLF